MLTTLENILLLHYRFSLLAIVAVISLLLIFADNHRRKRRRNFYDRVPSIGEVSYRQQALGMNNYSEENVYGDAVISSPRVVKSKPSQDPKILTLHVIAANGEVFAGNELLFVFLNTGLQHGKMNIFHYYADEHDDHILFSLASISKPGIFDLNRIDDFTTPGLTLFMELNKPYANLASFEVMLSTAQQIADELNGVVLDDRKEPLTDESLHRYRNYFKK